MIYSLLYRYQTKTTANILDTILDIQPKDSSTGTGETRESCVYRLATDMLSKLPAYYVGHLVEKRLNEMGSLQPMNIFLRQEIDRMQKVLKIVGSILTDMRLAIDGTIIMNENLRDAVDCIYDAKVPHFWEKVRYFFFSSELLLGNTVLFFAFSHTNTLSDDVYMYFFFRRLGIPQVLVFGSLS